jgi:hypothetical protein
MKKSIADRWVKALLSGQYKQGTGRLENARGGNCCLGVLCRILRVPKSGGRRGTRFGTDQDESDHYLPHYVSEAVGMRSCQGQLPNSPSLATMNDHDYSFEEIAAVIKKKYKLL